MTDVRRALVTIAVVALGCWLGTGTAEPFPGGLPVCLEELSSCNAGLATCSATLDARTADLASCTSKLSASETNLAACTSDGAACKVKLSASEANLATCAAKEAACAGNLTTCTAGLATSAAQLATCTNSLAGCTADLGVRTTDLGICTANFGACTTDLGACTTNLGVCTTDLGACTTDLGTCQAALALAQQFPASGQTACWSDSGAAIPCAGTGQDGQIRAGAVLSYTDNGDGTITDENTKLVWAKKSMDGSIHDVSLTFTWADAFVHIAALNSASFAGYSDWRLPNVRELQSIVDYGHFSPAVSAAFNHDCVSGATALTGSCTMFERHWTSTAEASFALAAWGVDFDQGRVGAFFKISPLPVRAVRGGL